MTATSPVVHCDPDILGGTPVFVGTRVPVRTLIEYLEAGVRVNKQFIETDAGIPVGSLERPWVRSVKLAGAS